MYPWKMGILHDFTLKNWCFSMKSDAFTRKTMGKHQWTRGLVADKSLFYLGG
jgi:hypothetical protein